jgi:hypothetical protein
MCEVLLPVPLYIFVALCLGTFTYWIDGRMGPIAVPSILLMDVTRIFSVGSSQFSKRVVRKSAYKLTFESFKTFFFSGRRIILR